MQIELIKRRSRTSARAGGALLDGSEFRPLRAALLAAAVIAFSAIAAPAQSADGSSGAQDQKASESDGNRQAQQQKDDRPDWLDRRYPVSQFLLDFSDRLPVHPPAKRLMNLQVKLAKAEDGAFVARGQAEKNVKLRLSKVPNLKKARFSGGALRSISGRIERHFAEWGYSGITARPHPDDINKKGKDVRLDGQSALRLRVGTDGTWTGVPGRPDETETASSYTVSQFLVSFDPQVPKRPPASEVMRYAVDLGVVDSGYVGPRPGLETVRIRLGDVPKLDQHEFYPSAIKTICKRIEKHLADRGFGELDCQPSSQDINEKGKDVRFENQTALRLVVKPAPVEQEKPKGAEAPAKPKKKVEPKPEPPPLAEATEEDGRVYPVSQLLLEYAEPHPNHPPLREVMRQTKVALARAKKGYVAWDEGDPNRKVVRLTEIPLLSTQKLYGSAVRAISEAVVRSINERGFIGVNVAPHPEDIGNNAKDKRPEGITALRMVVRMGRVTEVRTVASGDRVEQEERINNPVHEEVVKDSPVRPAQEGEDKPNDLLRKEALDRYIARLNRHPSRQVEASVSPARQPGGIALDYLVAENKPWSAYFQASNTGTENTDEWRERFGFVHHQLTGNDDTLSLDYITAGFDEAHTFIGSYEAPFMDAERIRWRAEGLWSEFTASDVGFAGEDFTGEEWQAGGEMIFNIFQHDQLFVDLVAGAKFQHDQVNNEPLNTEGETDFFLPHVGLELERRTRTANTRGLLEYEINAADVAGTSRREMNFLGRDLSDPATGDLSEVEENFQRVKWELTQTAYLEPLLWPEKWKDAETAASSTLAHEVAFSFKGQWSPDRLTPQFQRVAGGLYSVRGYDESVVSGDTVLLASAEYRLHIPRLLPLEQEPRQVFGEPFRFAPQRPYGRPDWDLMFRTFFDYGKTWNTDRRRFERDFDMMSTGVGLEFLFKRHLNVRVDYGYVLEGLEARTDEGSDRVHISATLLY